MRQRRTDIVSTPLWSGCITRPAGEGVRPMHRTMAMLAVAACLMAGCAASREARVRAALTDAGLPAAMAQCMATPLARDLSNSQLRSLSRVAKLAETKPANLSEQQVLNLLKRDLDPETVGVVVRAGLGCFLRG